MQFAHMIGQHHYESFPDKLSHTVFSWAGFTATVIIGGILYYVSHKRLNKPTAKEKIKK